MLEARKSRWFERVFAVYNRSLLARRFEGLRVAGLEQLRARPSDAPLVLYANHSSWWDGLVAFELGRAAGLEQYVMMEERQLRAYPLFRRLGAFSVVREDARAAALSVDYAARLLRHTARALWIFPQGETLPNDARPLRLQHGAAHIIRRAGEAWAAPVALRYEFLADFRPEAFVRIGSPECFSPRSRRDVRVTTELFAANLTRALERIKEDVLLADFADYTELVALNRRRKSQARGRRSEGAGETAAGGG